MSLETMRFWPFGVVWARERGWLEAQDPWTGAWFEIQANDAPSGWVHVAMQSRDPRKIGAPKNKHYRRVRIDELDAPRQLPGYA